MFKNKKVISLLLAFITCCSMTSTVFADTQAMKVSAKRVSEYSVIIPSTLPLTTADKQNFTGTYTVGVKGDVAANDTVYLRPQVGSGNTFEMTGKADSSNKVNATVTQADTEWLGSTLSTETISDKTGTVTVEITKADEYSGDLIFEYGITSGS